MNNRDVVARLRRMVWLDSNMVIVGGRSVEVESVVGGAPEPLSASVSGSPDPEAIGSSACVALSGRQNIIR